MHRIGGPLALVVTTLLLAGCAAAPPAPESGSGPSTLGAPCRTSNEGVRNADAPIVCVDDSADVLRVHPDPFWIHETHSKGAAAGTPAVRWLTTSGRGDLRIRFVDEGCVRNVQCNGGQCTAVAAKLAAGEKQRRCKYDVELTGHPILDPEGVLTGCCMAEDGEG